MIIRKIRLGYFGALKNLDLELCEGMNIIYGENESGKSTIQAFMKAIFYGMNSQKKDIKENDRIHYIPWGESKASGQIYISDQNSNDFIISRSFGKKKKEDESVIVHGITGETALHIPIEQPGLELFGFSEDTFEKTVWIKQLGSQVIRGKEDEITKRLTNLQESGDETVSYHQSLNALVEAKKTLVNTRKTGRLDKSKESYDKLLYEQRNSELLQKKLLDDQLLLNNLLEQRSLLEDKIIQLDKIKIDRAEYDIWLQSTNQLKQVMAKIIEQNEKAKIVEVSMKDYLGFVDLEEDAEYHMIKCIDTKKHLEEKMQEYITLDSEYRLTEGELSNFHTSFGKLSKFQGLTKVKEMEIYGLEEALKEQKHKKEQGTKNSNLALRIELYKDKQKNMAALSAFALIVLLAGLAGGYFANSLFYFISGVILLVGIYSEINRGKIRAQIKSLEQELSSLDTLATIDIEILRLSKLLKEIYSELGVSNLAKFREGIALYEEKKNSVESMKIILQEKKQTMDKIDIKKIKDQLTHLNEEINNTFQLCQCEDMHEFKKKFREYKNLLNNKILIEEELLKYEEMIAINKEELEKIEYKLGDRLKDFKESPPISIEDRELLSKEAHSSQIQTEKEIKDVENSLNNMFNHFRPILLVDEEMEMVHANIQSDERLASSLETAAKLLEESFKEMQSNFVPRLNRVVGDILGRITDGKYDELKVSEDYSIKVVDQLKGQINNMDYFSSGTRDQLYFSLRMGLIQILVDEGRKTPILLDDALLQYDDIRLAKALDYLYQQSKNHQIILFSCQKREMELLRDYSGVNIISLQ